MSTHPEKLPGWKKVMFASGNFGWSLGTYGIANLITYFYMPNIVDGEAMFPPFIFKGAVFMGLTILGLIIAGGRLFDAVTDPLIAGLSDRSQSKFGKRRFFMAIGGLPLALLSFLVFFPPMPTPGLINAVYIAVTLFLYYLFFTIYAAPYNALVSELGHTPNERLDLSTFNSVAWALGFLIGNVIYVIQGAFEGAGMDSTQAFQLSLVIFGIVSLITLYLPVIFIDEKRYCASTTSSEGSFAAMASSLKNRNFRNFLFSEVAYWFALTFIQTGISYYVVTLLGLDKGFATLLMTILFLLSFVFYLPINLFAKRFGKRATEWVGFGVFAVVYIVVIFLGKIPLPPHVQGVIIGVLGALPMAIFGIIPVAIIADVAEADGRVTGNYKAGIFYAMRGLFMKIGSSSAGLIFPSIIIIGTGTVNEFGIRLTGAVAFVFCIVGALLMRGYNEPEVRAILADEIKEKPEGEAPFTGEAPEK